MGRSQDTQFHRLGSTFSLDAQVEPSSPVCAQQASITDSQRSEHCARCGRSVYEAHTSAASAGVRICLSCHLRSPSPQVEVTGRARTKFRGLARAAHIGQIIAQDTRAGVRLEQTLRDIREINAVGFAPPYSDGRLRALTRQILIEQGVTVG